MVTQCDPMLGPLPLCQCSASYFTATRKYACVLKLLRIKGAGYDMDFRVLEPEPKDAQVRQLENLQPLRYALSVWRRHKSNRNRRSGKA
uniref:AlNc14C457G11767 protein n=1 Tax=Albugo laibachii Nc14 TaxID=890382 RepID=F0X028_9STRA|nr:AlNc14C457G11767 [Albugo laibachii Nc14]|eukprot:CCA27110.1 AlNc14C457G11767 [Albugo laibachii Nc14]